MHSDHRARYHVRPAYDVYPGDRISTDATAIDAAAGDRDADARVDWTAIEDTAALVRNRRRTTPTRLRFATTSGPVTRDLTDDVLVVQQHTDGTAD